MNKSSMPLLSDQLTRQRRDQLLHDISLDQGLPSLGVAIAKVIQITSDGEESVNKLARFILADVGLTKEILNLANSVSYRNSQGTSVTTITKAIFILGFDVVKTSALGMLMLEYLNEQDEQLYYELTRSLCASILARECVARSMYQDAEEASISALFKNIGQLLLASHAPDIYRAIMEPVNSGEISLHYSAVLQLGCNIEHFGSQILQQWGMPESIVQTVASLPPGAIKKTRHRSEWIKQVAAFSADASDVVMRNSQFQFEGGNSINFESEKYTKELMQRYAAALDLDPKMLSDWLTKTVKETEQLAIKLGMRLVEKKEKTKAQETTQAYEEGDLDDDLPDEFKMHTAPVSDLKNSLTYPSGKPYNARDLLLAGLMDLTQTISGGKFQLNDVVLKMLTILHDSLGFQFATASLKDAKTERYIARISIGSDSHQKQKNFSFSSKDGVDLFGLSLKNNADLMIEDTATPKIHRLLPEWHLTNFPNAKSVMLLPLLINGRAIGLIYAERDCIAPEGVPPDETALIKTMKSQLLAAMSR
jgi:HD-like signal output (HDOD) protein